MSMKFTLDSRQSTAAMKAANAKFNILLSGLMDLYAVEVQDTARNGAPWTDRTSNARNALTAFSFADDEGQGIVLSHGMDYGIYLETMQSGKYRIIMPTIDAILPRVIKGASKLLAAL